MIIPNRLELFIVGKAHIGRAYIGSVPTQNVNWDVIQEIHFGTEPALINGLWYVPLVCLIRGQEIEVIAVTDNLTTLQTAIQNITTFQEVMSDIDWQTAPLPYNNPHRHGPFPKLIVHTNFLTDV